MKAAVQFEFSFKNSINIAVTEGFALFYPMLTMLDSTEKELHLAVRTFIKGDPFLKRVLFGKTVLRTYNC